MDLAQEELPAFLNLETLGAQVVPGQQPVIPLFVELAVLLEEGVALNLAPQLGVSCLKPQALPGLEEQGLFNELAQGHLLELQGLDHLGRHLAPGPFLVSLHQFGELPIEFGHRDDGAVDFGRVLGPRRFVRAHAPENEHHHDGPDGQVNEPGTGRSAQPL